MSLVSIADCAARGITLPTDPITAQGVIDGRESWLSRRIGPLVGARTEKFYVGVGASTGRLGLRRFTDSVAVVDGGGTVNVNHYRLVANGSEIVRTYTAASPYWTGPYVEPTYTPNDEDEVREAIFALISLALDLPTTMESEQIGSYSYRRGGAPGTASPAAQRGIIVSGLLPKHDSNVTLHSARSVEADDPVINRRERDEVIA
jgi:hypothetical protein